MADRPQIAIVGAGSMRNRVVRSRLSAARDRRPARSGCRSVADGPKRHHDRHTALRETQCWSSRTLGTGPYPHDRRLRRRGDEGPLRNVEDGAHPGTRGGFEAHAVRLGPTYTRMRVGPSRPWTPKFAQGVAQEFHRSLPGDQGRAPRSGARAHPGLPPLVIVRVRRTHGRSSGGQYRCFAIDRHCGGGSTFRRTNSVRRANTRSEARYAQRRHPLHTRGEGAHDVQISLRHCSSRMRAAAHSLQLVEVVADGRGAEVTDVGGGRVRGT